MKVEGAGQFKPIIVTLETEEEADAMWHLLNVSKSGFEKTTDDATEVFRGKLDIQDRMWKIFNSTHRPPRKH